MMWWLYLEFLEINLVFLERLDNNFGAVVFQNRLLFLLLLVHVVANLC